MGKKISCRSVLFVKKDLSQSQNKSFNTRTNLPVCEECKGTEEEKKAEKEALDSLAEGFICGCI
ncbi:hypothetical protein [Marinilabilia salmonicolor]|uniref:hypothetical protein n=1 Tax=Marinilabilia salmonicolor TaxID=989 RepID=UPI00046A1270|nr:hypothetical protein [Marinilabilia salmonicolor]